jgi:hypothetical protein
MEQREVKKSQDDRIGKIQTSGRATARKSRFREERIQG